MSDKSVRYDRQLRLWGPEGQSRLEQATVLLINSSATASECLKNLVLPGIGGFVIADNQKVAVSDLGNNFFVTEGDVGHSKASTVARLLSELNDNVRAAHLEEDVESVLSKDSSFFKQFSLVIITQAPEHLLARVAARVWEENIPLLAVRSFGLLGYLRIVVPQHIIEESKPDNAPSDLRISKPFPELLQYVNSFDLKNVDDKEHKHIPFIVILLQTLDIWKSSHGGKPPQTRDEKDKFKELLHTQARKTSEENFQEALAQAYLAFNPYRIPYDIQELFQNPRCENLTAESSNFWIVVRAIRDFTNTEETLPLEGSCPDISSSTENFIRLQNIYKQKASADADLVSSRVASLLQDLKLPPSHISQEEIRKICKNAQFINFIEYRSIENEISNPLPLEIDEEFNDKLFYVALRAIDRYHYEHKRYPGSGSQVLEEEISELKGYLESLLPQYSLQSSETLEKILRELCRFGGAELHNVAALMGGVSAQEVIKLLTRQYTPVNNTFLYNGIHCRTISFVA